MKLSCTEAKKYIEKMPKAHPGITEWIYRYCAERGYMIYDREHRTAVCTICGKQITAEGSMHHNEEGKCPKCGSGVLYKAAGRGRKNLREVFRILECSHKGKTVWICCWDVMLDYANFGRPEIRSSLADVFVINEKEEHHFKKEYSWRLGDWQWNESSSMKVPYAKGGCIYGYSNPLETIYVYRENLEPVFTKSCMKYLWDPEFVNSLNAYQLVNYMSMGMKWQGVELLHKAGFRQLTMQRINGEYGSGCCYWAGATLQKVLRLPMHDVRYARDKDVSFQQLKTFQSIPEEYRQRIPWSMVNEISTYRIPGEWDQMGFECYIKKLNEYTDLKQWVAYRTKTIDQEFTLNDWIDYIDTAEKLGMDLRRKRVMFPDEFWKAHDDAVDTYECQKIDIQNRFLEQLEKQIHFENDNLTVIVATKQSQLNKESRSLHHCVKTYGEKIKNGQCLIFFIREKGESSKSYFTLETDARGHFRQCRGLRNCGMPDDVKQFAHAFCEYLQKALKKERKAA